LNTLLQDLSYALRQLRRSPGFALAAILTLGLGIGVNTGVFSVVNGVLLRPLPFTEPDRLVSIYTAYPEDEVRYPLSAPDFMSVREWSAVFEGVSAVIPSTATLVGAGDATELRGGWVVHDYFRVLGASVELGRGFTAEDNVPGNTDQVVLSHSAWRNRFGADPAVIGREIQLNGLTRTIVGVLEPGFDHPAEREIYLPLGMGEQYDATTATGRRIESLQIVGRVRAGVPHERVDAEMAALSQRLREEFPATNNLTELSALPLRDVLVGDVRTPLLILLGAVGLVLLIACGNVANLMLARASARQGELAVRSAMGASRRRLMRQFLTESLVLWLLGGVVAVLFAYAATRGILALAPEGIPRLEEVRLDAPTLFFAGGVSLLTGLLFGLAPALQATRGDLGGTLREGGRSGVGERKAGRLRSGLVIAEVALAVCLLVGAALLVRTFVELVREDPGFRSEQIVSTGVTLRTASYPEGTDVRRFYGDLLPRLEALPGVTAVTAVDVLPLSSGGSVLSFDVVGRERIREDVSQDMLARVVMPNYFHTMGIPLLQGRAFGTEDRFEAPSAILVNQAAAERYFPAIDPVGERISLGGEEEYTVVGVVGSVRQRGMGEAPLPEMYFPLDQVGNAGRSMQIVMRVRGTPESVFATARNEIRQLDPTIPIESFRTGDQLISGAVAAPRFYASLLALFAVTALLLAAVGIFGVISFSVSRRTREIGVRMALGADAGRVTALVVRGALVLAGLGLVIGGAVALVGTRLLSGLLYGVGAFDPLSFLAAGSLLMAIALLAAYLPARRASRVDPMVALRAE
jgi:putative ABC transport system permease protein